MQNLTSSSLPFKAGSTRRREDLSGYVALGLVMRKVRRLQRRELVQVPSRPLPSYAGARR